MKTTSAAEAIGVRKIGSEAHQLGPIDGLESLRQHLQCALEYEHFTIPPYLCALYSLDEARNQAAAEIVSSVVIEEMLHLSLVANLLNSIGGNPRLDLPRVLPGYPLQVSHGDHMLEIPLLSFCREAVDVFMSIEQPSSPSGPPEDGRYESIGQFYKAVEDGFIRLSDQLGQAEVFCGDPPRQVGNDTYSGGGRIIQVTDLASALAALNEIVEQGEGSVRDQVWDGDTDVFHPERQQVAHYYRFQELKLGRRYRRGDTPATGPTGESISIDWDGVHLMRSNSRIADSPPNSPVRKAQEEFNRHYCNLLAGLELAFNGSPPLLVAAVEDMYWLKTKAKSLMTMPMEDGANAAGPSFEYVAPSDR